MGNQFEDRAKARDAKLGATRTEHALGNQHDEAAVLKRRSNLNQQVSDRRAGIEDQHQRFDEHQGTREARLHERMKASLRHQQINREASHANALHGRDAQLFDNNAQRTLVHDKQVEQANDAHASWKQEISYNAYLADYDSRAALAQTADAIKLTFAQSRDVHHSQENSERSTRQEAHRDAFESNQDKASLDQTNAFLADKNAISRSDLANETQYSEALSQHDSDHRKGVSAARKGHADDSVAGNNTHADHQDAQLFSSLTDERDAHQGYAGRDFTAEQSLAHAQRRGDIARNDRNNAINEFTGQPIPQHENQLDRVHRDLTHVKDYVSNEMESRRKSAFRDAAYDKQAMLKQTDSAQSYIEPQEGSTQQAIDAIHEQMLIRKSMQKNMDGYHRTRALKEDKQSEPVAGAEPKTTDREQRLEHNLDALKLEKTVDTLSVKEQISSRTHDYVRSDAFEDNAKDVMPREERSDRNKHYANLVQGKFEARDKARFNGDLDNTRDDVQRRATRAADLEQQRSEDALIRGAGERALSAKHADGLITQSSRNEQADNTTTNRELLRGVNAAYRENQSHAYMAQAFISAEKNHAMSLAEIDRTHRTHQSEIFKNHQDTHDSLEQARSSLHERTSMGDVNPLLVNRNSEARSDLSNVRDYAWELRGNSGNESNDYNQIAQQTSEKSADQSEQYHHKQTDRQLGQVYEAKSLYGRHAIDLYAEKTEEALELARDKITSHEKLEEIVQTNASWEQDINQYEGDVHDETGVLLAHIDAQNHLWQNAGNHEVLLQEASDDLAHDSRMAGWENDRLHAQSDDVNRVALEKDDLGQIESINQAHKDLAEYAFDAHAFIDTAFMRAQGRQAIDSNSRELRNDETVFLSESKTQIREHYETSSDHQSLVTVHDEKNSNNQIAQIGHEYFRNDTLGHDALDVTFSSKQRKLNEIYGQYFQQIEEDLERDLDALQFNMTAQMYQRNVQRKERDEKRTLVNKTIDETNKKIQTQGKGKLSWLVSNYEQWFEKLDLVMDDYTDDIKDYFASKTHQLQKATRHVAYGHNLLKATLSFTYQHIRIKKQTRVQGWFLSAKNYGSSLVSSMVRRGSDAIASVRQRFMALGLFAAYQTRSAAQSAQNVMISVGVESKVAIQTAGVEAGYLTDRAAQTVVPPARNGVRRVRDAFASFLHAFFSGLQNLYVTSMAAMRKSINAMWTGVERSVASFSVSYTRLRNGMVHRWRETTRGWGKATRKARRAVVLPAKQTAAKADKQRQMGLLKILTLPAVWWRAAKHEMSLWSWRVSAWTYEPRMAVKNTLHAGVDAAGHCADELSNDVDYHGNRWLIGLGAVWGAVLAAVGYGARSTSNKAAQKIHRVDEALPSPSNAIQSAELSVTEVVADVKRVLATASNDLNHSEKTTVADLSHAMHRAHRPARSKAIKGKNKTLRAKDGTIDAAMGAGDAAVNGAKTMGAVGQRAGASVAWVLSAMSRAVTAAGGEFVHVSSRGVRVYIVNPSQAVWNVSGQGMDDASDWMLFQAGDKGQTLRDTGRGALAIPGKATAWVSLTTANALDKISPDLSYAYARTGLIAGYYGEVVWDGMAYVVQLMSETLQAPVELIIQTIDASSDATMAYGTHGLEHGDLICIRMGVAGAVAFDRLGMGWTNLTNTLGYSADQAGAVLGRGVRDVAVSVSNGLDSFGRDKYYQAVHGVNATGDTVENALDGIAYYGTAAGITLITVPATWLVNGAHGATLSVNALSAMGQYAVAFLAFYATCAVDNLGNYAAQTDETITHGIQVTHNALGYGATIAQLHAAHDVSTALTHVTHAAGSVFVPLAQLRSWLSQMGFSFENIKHSALYHTAQGADVVVCAVKDTADDLSHGLVEGVRDVAGKGVLAAGIVNDKGQRAAGHTVARVKTDIGGKVHQARQAALTTAYHVDSLAANAGKNVRNAGTHVHTSAGRTKDAIVSPVSGFGLWALMRIMSAAEQVFYVGALSKEKTLHSAQTSKLLMTRHVAGAFNIAEESVINTSQAIRAECGKRKDNVLEKIHSEYNVNYKH